MCQQILSLIYVLQMYLDYEERNCDPDHPVIGSIYIGSDSAAGAGFQNSGAQMPAPKIKMSTYPRD